MGWNRSEMIALYKMLLESCVWYASSAWLPWVSKCLQREGLRVCTGLTKTAPTESVNLEAGIDSIIVNAKRKGMFEYEKVMRENMMTQEEYCVKG